MHVRQEVRRLVHMLLLLVEPYAAHRCNRIGSNRIGSNRPSQLNAANIARLLEMMRQNNQRILEQSASHMTPGQLKTLEQYLSQNLKNTETGLKMGGMITGK